MNWVTNMEEHELRLKVKRGLNSSFHVQLYMNSVNVGALFFKESEYTSFISILRCGIGIKNVEIDFE